MSTRVKTADRASRARRSLLVAFATMAVAWTPACRGGAPSGQDQGGKEAPTVADAKKVDDPAATDGARRMPAVEAEPPRVAVGTQPSGLPNATILDRQDVRLLILLAEPASMYSLHTRD